MKQTIQFAFQKSVPILFGYLFIGIAFGLMLQKAGYHWIWAALCSVFIYAGSLQYVLVALLTSGASLLTTFMISLIVNGRQIFYGLSLVEKFKGFGKWKPYMIFSLTDETYSVLCSLKVPEGVHQKRAMFLISFFNQCYWVIGSLLGAILGDVLNLNAEGIEFAMTALFTVIFIDYLREKRNHLPAIIGLVSSVCFFVIMTPESFIIPSLFTSAALLIIFKGSLENGCVQKTNAGEEQ